MKLEDFNYDLPQELIAQQPSEKKRPKPFAGVIQN